MNTRTLLLLLAALLAAAPALAREDESRGRGGDDAVAESRGRGGDDGPGDDRGGDDDSDDDDSDDDNGGGDSGSWVRARRDLFRAAGSPDGDVKGYVEVRTRGLRQRFKVEAEHLDAGASVEFLVEDGSGTMATAGTGVADAFGEAELELDTGDGAALPGGASTVAELAGRRVEVRDGSGALLLEGSVPGLDGAAAPNRTAKVRIRDGETGVRVEVRMKDRPRRGRQEFRLDVKKASPDADLGLWIDDGSGTLADAATLRTARNGKARIRLRSKDGNAMPLGGRLGDLSGRAFEVRGASGTLASGAFPVL